MVYTLIKMEKRIRNIHLIFQLIYYFTVLDHDGYKVYEDEDGTKEFTHYQMEVQNPDLDLSLCIKAESSK